MVPGRGLLILVRRSKADPQGRGQDVAVWANAAEPGFCPVATLNAWLTHRFAAADLQTSEGEAARAGRLTGAALSDKAAVRLVKQAAIAAGLDPARFPGTRSVPGSPLRPAMPGRVSRN